MITSNNADGVFVAEAGEGARELVPSVSIEAFLARRDAVISLVNDAIAKLVQASELAQSNGLGFPHFSMAENLGTRGETLTGEYTYPERIPKALQTIVDAGGWRYLLNQSGMRSLMCASKRADFEKQLRAETIPPLTRESIQGTFGALYAGRADMFEQGVIECFRKLSWHYKTNLPHKFGKRIVLTYLTSYGSAREQTTDHLDDLMRVFHVLDRKPEADHRRGCFLLIDRAMHERGAQWPRHCENDYVSIRLFKNHNGHVTFKRPDLIDALNRIIAKHYPNALPAPL